MATDTQLTALKASANRVLQRNHCRNRPATFELRRGSFQPPKVAPNATPQRVIWHYRIKGSGWLILISPCDDLTEIEHQLRDRFGNRFIEVRPCEKFHQQ